MPLNGHEYLVSQGWHGKGSGLRKGAISRPIMVAQKKSLSGVGKDRDEAFPFWDQYVPHHCLLNYGILISNVKCVQRRGEHDQNQGL